MQFALSPKHNACAPYAEVSYPLFCDSIDRAKQEATEILIHNQKDEPHILKRVTIIGDKIRIAQLTLSECGKEVSIVPIED